jgi:hypothetical protein
MRKLIFGFVVLFFSMVAMGQHMTFKGVEIDGSVQECVDKLVAKGFRYVGVDDNDVVMMIGDFAGFRDCKVIVFAMEEVGVVNSIGVVFPEKEDWSSVERDYNMLKEMLTEKYGLPYKVVEEFHGRVFDDNELKFMFLTTDRCTWMTTFETDKGDIELFVQKIDYKSAAVVLKYYDKFNTDMVRSAAIDDL